MMCYEVRETVFQIRVFHTRITAVNKYGEDVYLRLSGVTKRLGPSNKVCFLIQRSGKST